MAAAIEKEFIYLPSRQRYERSASATNSDRLESIQVGPLYSAAIREIVLKGMPSREAFVISSAPFCPRPGFSADFYV